MSGQQRKDEILAKRAKLAELKRTREQRDKQRAQRESGIHSGLDVYFPFLCLSIAHELIQSPRCTVRLRRHIHPPARNRRKPQGPR